MCGKGGFRFLLIGPPGSGKGTYSERLARRFEVPHIATGDMLREAVESGTEMGKIVEGYLDRGELVPDELIIKVVEQRLLRPDARKGFSLDGFPRTLPQAKMLDELMTKMGWDFDYIFFVWADREEIIERTVNRVQCEDCGEVYNLKNNPPKEPGVCDQCGGKVIKREDDTEEMILHRFKVYDEKTAPMVDHYSSHPNFYSVNTGGPVGRAEKKMLELIKENEENCGRT